MNLNLNFNGKTLLRDWWSTVRENFETIQTAVSEFATHKTAAELDHPDKSVTSKKIADKAVGTGQIADYSISQTKLAQYSVSSAKIYPGAVLTSHIKDGNITKEKLDKSLRDLMDELKYYAPTYNVTFSDFELGDALYFSGEETDYNKVVDNDFVYLQDTTDQWDHINYSLPPTSYYFAGIGAVSGVKDAYKTIHRLAIKSDFVTVNGNAYDYNGNINLYRVTDDISIADAEYGVPIPASDYQIIKKNAKELEIVFLTPITLAELAVHIEMSCDWGIPEEDDNANYLTMSAYPRFGFLAEVKVTDDIDTELSDSSVNAVENRAVKAGIDAAKQEAIDEVSASIPEFATKRDIKAAWKAPVPLTSVTLNATYNGGALVVTTSEIEQLLEIGEGEVFDLNVNVDVDTSGGSVYFTAITTEGIDSPSYELTHSVHLYDGEYTYNSYTCIMISHYDKPDIGEIQVTSY